jgi:hypothetical protein
MYCLLGKKCGNCGSAYEYSRFTPNYVICCCIKLPINFNNHIEYLKEYLNVFVRYAKYNCGYKFKELMELYD